LKGKVSLSREARHIDSVKLVLVDISISIILPSCRYADTDSAAYNGVDGYLQTPQFTQPLPLCWFPRRIGPSSHPTTYECFVNETRMRNSDPIYFLQIDKSNPEKRRRRYEDPLRRPLASFVRHSH
jgi:hypothetical protein